MSRTCHIYGFDQAFILQLNLTCTQALGDKAGTCMYVIVISSDTCLCFWPYRFPFLVAAVCKLSTSAVLLNSGDCSTSWFHQWR